MSFYPAVQIAQFLGAIDVLKSLGSSRLVRSGARVRRSSAHKPAELAISETCSMWHSTLLVTLQLLMVLASSAHANPGSSAQAPS